jgi:hypothetical protein
MTTEENAAKKAKTCTGDPYIGKPVAFCVVEEPWMTNKEYGKLGTWYLAGNVTRRELVSSSIEATTEYGEVQLNQRGSPLCNGPPLHDNFYTLYSFSFYILYSLILRVIYICYISSVILS